MRPFEKEIEAACATAAIPGAVLLASDRSGKFSYARAFGKRSVRAGADQSALRLDSVMWIASCTKLLTALAAMQCVERGLLSLDSPVYDVLPEFRGRPVITGTSAEGVPALSAHRKPITLRHLLSHSSGLAYDETHPALLEWHAWRGTKPNRDSTVAGRFSHPLVFEPGDGWAYGPGLDWAGIMIERVTGAPSLQHYFEEHIFKPVGARDIAFSSHLARVNPGMLEQPRLTDMSKRDPASPERVKRSNADLQWNSHGDCMGGLGLFSDPVSYMKVLVGILSADTDGVLLKKKESVDEFFRPCLSERSKEELNTILQIKEFQDGMGNLPGNVVKNWALGGIVNEQDAPGTRKAGSMAWGGLPNLAWSIDRKAGMALFYASQLLPPADTFTCELGRVFEKGIYEMYNAESSKL